MEGIIKYNFFENFYRWLKNNDFPIRMKNAILWTMSNFSVGPEAQIIHVFPTQEHSQFIVSLCHHEEVKISREAIYTICNITNQATYRRKH